MKRKSAAGDVGSSPQKASKIASVIKYLDLEQAASAHDAKIINEWDVKFYNDIHGSAALSDKQLVHKNRIEFKIDVHAAKMAGLLDEFEMKFCIDHYEPRATLSEKQKAVKARVDAKLELWKAHKAKLINDWDLQFMISSMKTEKLSAKQQVHKDRIEKQLEATSAVLAGGVLDDFEVAFFQQHASKVRDELSAKQRPIMNRIDQKLRAWQGHKDGLISGWERDFLVDIVGKENLSEKQIQKQVAVEKKLHTIAGE